MIFLTNFCLDVQQNNIYLPVAKHHIIRSVYLIESIISNQLVFVITVMTTHIT